MNDVLLMGQGLAASVLMHTFHEKGLSFTTIGLPGLSNCSQVAAGVWNPVVFKRMTGSWLADDLVPSLNQFYAGCEARLQTKLIAKRPIIKPFTEDQEKDLWLKKAKAGLGHYLDASLHEQLPPELAHCKIPNGYGVVKQSGNLNVAAFLSATQQFFKNHIVSEAFDYGRLQIFPDKVVYGHVQARRIVFCEGHLVSNNPYFNWIPLKPARGEILTLAIKDLQFNNLVFNRNGFLMDVEPGLYKLGATYEWQDLSEAPTEKGRKELLQKLAQMTDCDYTLVKHEAGIRPSSLDRRPLIGRHPLYNNLFVFNGLGTKGVMLAPFFANNFVHFCLQKELLHPEVNLSRFYHLYENHKT